MSTITMTQEQTTIYDSGDDRVVRNLMKDLCTRAQQMADSTDVECEVYTADGIVVHVAEPMPTYNY